MRNFNFMLGNKISEEDYTKEFEDWEKYNNKKIIAMRQNVKKIS